MAQHLPCGEGRVVRIAQQLVWVSDWHQPVSEQLKAQTLILWRLIHCWKHESWCEKSTSHIVWMHTCPKGTINALTRQSVIHVKSIALDVFKCQTPVHKHPEGKDRRLFIWLVGHTFLTVISIYFYPQNTHTALNGTLLPYAILKVFIYLWKTHYFSDI